jgi:hypothetical protein
MLGEAVIGLNALKTAFDISKGLKDISDATIRNGAIIELQQKILDAQAAQFELVRRVDELEKEKALADASRAKMDRYQLKEYGANTFAYELKADAANGEPVHRVCADCYNKGAISILQFSHHSSGQDWYDCRTCGRNQHFGQRIAQSSAYVSNYSDF